MKRIVSILTAVIVLISMCNVVYPELNKVEVSIDGTLMPLEPGAFLMDGSVYAPINTISSAIGATVKKSMNGQNEVYTITRSKTNREIRLESGIKKIKVNGVENEIDIEPILIAADSGTNKQYVLVPVKLLAERLGGEASFSQNKVFINSYKPVTLIDKNLEAVVRSIIKIPSGELYVGDMASIKTLLASGKGITNIEDLKYFRSLSNLDLSKNNITDFSPLSGLKNLSFLHLKENPTTDYAPVAAYYKTLTEKDFQIKAQFADKKIEEAVAEAAKKKPEELTMDDLLKIKELNLSGKEITDLEGIDYIANLTKLDISKNNISNIDSLRNLTELQELVMNTNKLESAVKLSFLTNLVKLDLSGNKIPDIAPLANCVKLKELLLNGNKASVIYPIKSLINLEKLDLSANGIADLTGIEKLTKLKELYLVSNSISSIDKLSGLTELVALHIKGNDIQDYSPLFRFKKLAYVDVLGAIGTPPANATATPATTASSATAAVTPTPPPPGSTVIRFYVGKKTYTVNGVEKSMDTMPVMKDGRTFLPVRYASEAVGAKVDWDSVAKKATITSGTKVLALFINKEIATVDGSLVEIDVAPFLSDGRTMLPIRFVSENLGLTVEWDAVKKEVTLIKAK